MAKMLNLLLILAFISFEQIAFSNVDSEPSDSFYYEENAIVKHYLNFGLNKQFLLDFNVSPLVWGKDKKDSSSVIRFIKFNPWDPAFSSVLILEITNVSSNRCHIRISNFEPPVAEQVPNKNPSHVVRYETNIFDRLCLLKSRLESLEAFNLKGSFSPTNSIMVLPFTHVIVEKVTQNEYQCLFRPGMNRDSFEPQIKKWLEELERLRLLASGNAFLVESKVRQVVP